MRSASESADAVDSPPQCGWASCNELRAWIEQNLEEGKIHLPFFPASVLELVHLTSPSFALGLEFIHWAPLGPRPPDWITRRAFLSLHLQTLSHQTPQPPKLHEPVPLNHYIASPFGSLTLEPY